MNSSVSFPFVAPDLLRQVARWLAVAQQLKDTIAILMLSVFVVILPIAWPGLLLYILRWRLVGRGATAHSSRMLWGCTLVHELLCLGLFAALGQDSGGAAPLIIGYLLGFLLALGALLTLAQLEPSVPAEAPETAPLP